MNANYFLDTNIFIYQLEKLDADKYTKAHRLIAEGLVAQSAVVSFQVVQECINISLKKAEITLSHQDIKTYMENVLMPLCQVLPSKMLYGKAIDLQARYKYGFYDSLIVAAALEADCNVLYSEDLQDGQVIDGLTIKNPFALA
ncbi:MAG: PIN domain-containing protein [Methyloglobulus sp.]|nr:PIN domain-containing protein [Methyloglobulus sp.]